MTRENKPAAVSRFKRGYRVEVVRGEHDGRKGVVVESCTPDDVVVDLDGRPADETVSFRDDQLVRDHSWDPNLMSHPDPLRFAGLFAAVMVFLGVLLWLRPYMVVWLTP